MSRKIVYIKADNKGFPALDSIYPSSKILSTDKTVANTTYFAGQPDPEYRIPEWSILMMEDDDKNYYSILSEYTNEQIANVDPDYEIKTDLDGNFTYTLLKYGKIREYNQLLSLGCPEYDANVHTTYTIQNHHIPPEDWVAGDITTRGIDDTPNTEENN